MRGASLLCTNRCTTLFPHLGGLRRPAYGPPGQPHPPTGRRTLWRGTTSGRPSTCSTASPGTPTWSTWTGPWRSAGASRAPLSTTCAPLAMPAGWPSASVSRPAGEAGADVQGHEDRPLSRHPGGTPPVADRPRPGAFRLVNAATGQAILDRGELDWD